MEPLQSRVVLTDARGKVNLNHAPEIPVRFLCELTQFDPDLFVLWSPTRGRYFIHQCIEHTLSGTPVSCGHTQLCRSSYVLVAQDVDGTMVPLNERVINTLRQMRATSESFGGQTERGLQSYKNFSDGLDRKMAEDRENKLQDVMQYSRKDNRLVWNKLWALASTHLFSKPNK